MKILIFFMKTFFYTKSIIYEFEDENQKSIFFYCKIILTFLRKTKKFFFFIKFFLFSFNDLRFSKYHFLFFFETP